MPESEADQGLFVVAIGASAAGLEGWRVVTYPSAESFLAAPRSEGNACLVVDTVLPGMDGVTLIARLRKQQSRLPAVMLTTREHEVLERVLEGQPIKIIAHDLAINQRTAENHRASVMRKTGAASLPALVRLALAADAQGN